MSENEPEPRVGQFLFYDTEDGTTRIHLWAEHATVWIHQKAIAELFETSVANVNTHISNIIADSEVQGDSVIKDYLITAADGKQYRTKHYNLDMLLAIGYRVRSPRGVQFRRWATGTLREYLVKGFVLNDERLKAAESTFGTDYFDELLERIRSIRASERRFYQKITDIYATSSDYSRNSKATGKFFATVQNKLEWAITGMTAAGLIHSRADADQPNMGLQTWKNSPAGKIQKSDVTVGKNYLTQEELSDLNRIVTMYLDYAEDQAKRGNVMTMAGWAGKLDAFLEFNQRGVLKDAGKIEKKVADALAIEQFEQYQTQQRRIEASEPTSDFDRFIEDVKKLDPPTKEGEDE